MSKKKNRKIRAERKPANTEVVGLSEAELPAKRERHLEVFIAMVLLAFGAYLSILYFGHTVVPNSDFPAFNRVGHQLWSFQLPTKYRQGEAKSRIIRWRYTLP